MDKDAINTLGYKISEEGNVVIKKSSDIAMNTSGTAKDKMVIEFNKKNIKKDIIGIKESIHKIQEYLEEIESHIYDGEFYNE